MKTLITYSTLTGNTKQIAEAIKEVMPKDTVIASVEENIDPKDFDLVLLGFWVNQTKADDQFIEYTKRVTGKKVGIFATLGAYPDTQHATDALKNVRELLVPQNEVLKEFICQGKIDPKITANFEKLPPDHFLSMTPERRRKHKEALKHPDEEDIRNAKDAFRDII